MFAQTIWPGSFCDLEEQRNDLLPVFQEYLLNPKNIIDKLSFISGQIINPETDILILDEIHAVLQALTSLKNFCQNMPKLTVTAAGSNLELQAAQNYSQLARLPVSLCTH